MEAYTSFAEVYDLFMDNVPYENWCSYLKECFKEYQIEEGLVLDLGCGTGKLTRLMADAGYDMIGVDNSMEMLEIAREFEIEEINESDFNEEDPETGDEFSKRKRSILYLMQDMREFELYGTVRAVYSACDSLNYLLEEEDLVTVFKLVNNYLDKKGVFLFDLNTPYKYEKLLGENTFAENRDESSFIWDNYYDEEERINEYDLTLFIQEEDGRFQRFQEQHYQKCYSLELVKELLEEAGMEFVAAYDAYSKNPVRKDSEKMTIIAREKNNDHKFYTE